MKRQENQQQEIEWMGTAEAARYLGLTSRTVYRLIDEGQLPAYKFGRVIRLKRADVEAFVEQSRIEPGSLEHLYPEGRRDAAVAEGEPSDGK